MKDNSSSSVGVHVSSQRSRCLGLAVLQSEVWRVLRARWAAVFVQ